MSFTIVSSTDLNYFNTWSGGFHARFEKFKDLVKSDINSAIAKIEHDLKLTRLIPGSFTIASKQKYDQAFSSTTMNSAVLIVQGQKAFNTKEPQMLVALLFILDLIIRKDKVLEHKASLEAELENLNLLLEKM